MTSSRWYPRYGSDFVGGVVGLGPERIGALSIILDLIYDRGGPVPNDARWIGGILGCSTRRARSLIDQLIEREKLFVDGGGRLSNLRAETELQIIRKRIANQQLSGKKGGRTSRENLAKMRDNYRENTIDTRDIKDLAQGSLKPARASHNITKITSTSEYEAARPECTELPQEARREKRAVRQGVILLPIDGEKGDAEKDELEASLRRLTTNMMNARRGA